jgi:hypothetical protein
MVMSGIDYRLNVCNKVNEPNCRAKNGIMCQYYHGGTGVVAVLASASTPPTWGLIDPTRPQRGPQQIHTSGSPFAMLFIVNHQLYMVHVLQVICVGLLVNKLLDWLLLTLNVIQQRLPLVNYKLVKTLIHVHLP